MLSKYHVPVGCHCSVRQSSLSCNLLCYYREELGDFVRDAIRFPY